MKPNIYVFAFSDCSSHMSPASTKLEQSEADATSTTEGVLSSLVIRTSIINIKASAENKLGVFGNKQTISEDTHAAHLILYNIAFL